MPLYEYECAACGERTEVIRAYSDPPLTVCPTCGGALAKLLSSPAFQFKGAGWYATDYGKGGSKTGEGKGGDSPKGDEGKSGSGGAEATSAGAGESKKDPDSSKGKKDGGSAAEKPSPGATAPPAPSQKKDGGTK